MMRRQRVLLSLLGLSLLSTTVHATTGGWEASVRLSTLHDLHATPPAVLVPKQSVQMTATVWMPEKVNWFPQYPDWDMPGATIVPLFMLSPSIERQQGNVTQRGATQNYLLTPLSEGTLTLSTSSIIAYPDRKDSPVLPFPPVSVTVRMPPGAGDMAHFLPATGLKLTQTFWLLAADKQEQEITASALHNVVLKSGQLIERRILMEASGLQGNQIPALSPGTQVTQHDAETTDVINYDEFIGGTRTERWYYAPQTSGALTLKDINVHWYNTQQQRFQTTTVGGVSLKSEASAADKSAIQLTLLEQLSLVSAQTWWVLISAIVVFAILILNRRRVIRGSRNVIQRCTAKVTNAAWIRFMMLCLALACTGLSKRQNWRRYQRWLTGQNAEAIMQHPALKQWSAAVYSAAGRTYPGRFSVIWILFVHQAKIRKGGRTLFTSIKLPDILNVGPDR